jgi:hypothetical protein
VKASAKTKFTPVLTKFGNSTGPYGGDQEFWVRAERELVETAQDHS